MAATGSCLCGRFAFELEGELKLMSHCHCGRCRKAHGSAFATYAMAQRLRWISGEGEQAVGAGGELSRAFCPTCGSKVPAAGASENVFVAVGLLDGAPPLPAGGHIFVAHKAPWHVIDDALPRFDEYPPGVPTPDLATRPRPAGASEDGIASSCLCGAVAWEHTGASPRMGHCYCSRCRKLRGAAFSTQLFAAADDFRWIRGRDEVQEFQLPGAAFFGNSFCRACGSPAPRELDGGLVMMPAGTLDDDPITRPMAHIFVASKAPWVEITDSLPQFDEMPPG